MARVQHVNFGVDFGDSTTVALHKEKYFLLIQLHQQESLWTLPTTTRSSPAFALQDCIDLIGIVPSTIRCEQRILI